MAITIVTETYTGQPRDDIEVNDSVEWASKSYTWEFLGETRTHTIKTLKDNFVVSGVFDESACEAHLDADWEGMQKYINIKKWTEDPLTGVAIST